MRRQRVFGNTSGVTLLAENVSTPARGMTTRIASTFNSGWQLSDIRRAYLADNTVGSVTGPELVTNGTFDTDINGWGQSANASQSWSLGRIRVEATSGTSGFSSTQTIAGLVIGRSYQITATVESASGNSGVHARLRFSTAALDIQATQAGVPFTGSRIFVAAATSLTLSVDVASSGAWGAVGNVAFADNISVREVVADRSYKANGAHITGTLVKSEVTTAAQLVAYSGFSAANYLQEPYSADLDFGVGEWSVGAWVNTPTGNVAAATVAAREGATGAYIRLGIDATNKLTATAFDGTTTRTVTTTAAYNTATWLKARVNYTTDGTLAILVNGVQVAATYGNPLLSLNSRYNRFEYSQQFDQWGKQGTNSVTDINSVPAPDGTMTADVANISVGQGKIFRSYSGAVVGKPYVFSMYVKGVAGQTFRMGDDGTVAIQQFTMTGAWDRFFITGTAGSTANNATFFLQEGDTATSFAVWGAQYEAGSVPTAYQRVGAATDFDFAAPLTIGNSFALDAPFPGSIALLKLSATVPTAEQAVWMYEQEKHLFQAGAQCCLPDAGAIADLTYDEATDKWIAISATNESEWSGLVRTSVTAVPAGSYTRAVAGGGVQLLARSTTTPGVDVTIPAYGLREELVKRAEAAARLNAQTALYDFVGGFTATTTSGSTSITSAASLTYPVSYVGARVTGSGIPADTFVAAVVGTTVYLTKAATASASAVQISFTDFILPVGYEAKVVLAGGANKVEGATKDFTRLFDGFKETIRFGTAPGHTAAIQIQATRSAA